MRPALALLLLTLLAFWPRLSSAEWYGTEARRVQIAQEMLERGEWTVPTLGGEPTLVKPPLQYWVLGNLLRWGQDPAWLRLPALLSFWLLALAAFLPLRRYYSELSAWIGSVGILAAPIVLSHAATAEVDGLFAALTGISIVTLAEGAAFRRPMHLVVAGIAGGLALLTKGPPYLLFLAGTMLVWLRRLRLAGVGWFLPALLVLPAAYYGPLLWTGQAWNLGAVLQQETVGRMALFELLHFLDTPLHFGRAVMVLLPLGLWTFHEYRGDREMREAVLGREEALLRMCAGAMVGAVLLLVLFPARPIRYLLPGVPCFLIALAPAVAAYARWGTRPARQLGKLVLGTGLLGGLGLLVAPWLPHPWDRGAPWACAVLAIAALLVHARRGVVVWAIVTPLMLAWTLLPDWLCRRGAPPYAERTAGTILAREVERLGPGDLTTYGHVPSAIVLGLPRIPAGDETLRRTPASRWLLVEDPDREMILDGSLAPGYVDRIRLRIRGKSIVIKERS